MPFISFAYYFFCNFVNFNKMKKKISFDFDGTLSEGVVIDYARELILDPDIEVHIVTARMEEDYNDDLFGLAEDIGILEKNIHFTNFEYKADRFFKENTDYLWHLDDNFFEIEWINVYTPVVCINVKSAYWQNHCNKLLGKIDAAFE